MADKPRLRVTASGAIINDGLENVVANLGTGRDKAAHTTYVDIPKDPHELITTYRNSWVARAGVNYPAEDATRKWRNWRAESDQISKIEALERKLGLQAKVQEALTRSRLLGGAAIYINTEARDKSLPLRDSEQIKSIVVMSCLTLRPEPIVNDIDSEYYGKPEYYKVASGENAERVLIHASRLAVFHGADDIAEPGYTFDSQGWGDSVLKSASDSLHHRDATVANIASLIFEAKVDVFKFAGFADMLADGQDSAVLSRAHLQAAMKGINGAVVIDGQDDYEQKNASFAGLPELIEKMQEEVSGAFAIPVTRMFGRSAAGLSGSGDGDERVYYDRIGHEQATRITPALAKLDELIVRQALGSRPPEIHYEWAPLRQLTESDRAEIFSKTANAARALAGNDAGGVIPLDALSESLTNELTELGVLPGLEAAVEKYGSELGEGDFIPEGRGE